MARRPLHRLAHVQCPYGVTNWADCDDAAGHQWGRCVAMVEAKGEPRACTNWAVADDGWCGQHYISLHEKVRIKARDAERTLQLNARIDAFLEKTQRADYDWWSVLGRAADSTRGLQGVTPIVVKVAPPRVRKGPHRLSAPV